VLPIRIRDPGLGAFLTPGSISGNRDGKKSASGSGIRDEQSGSYFFEPRNHFLIFFGVEILKFFDEDPGSGMETVRIQDPMSGIEKSRIRDKHPGSATPKKIILDSTDQPKSNGIRIHASACVLDPFSYDTDPDPVQHFRLNTDSDPGF
jgi:hypothetical protein